MYKSKKIKIDTYPIDIRIVITNDLDKFKKKTGLTATSNNACWYDSEKSRITLQFHKETTFGIIAHECFHATNFIFKKIGAYSDVDNDENQAYLLEYLCDNVISFMNKKD